MSLSTLEPTAVVVPGNGTIAFADPNTAPIDPYKFVPGNASTYGAGWAISYTSKSNLPSFSKDGGEITTLDAWEQDAIASSQTPTSLSFDASKIQIDQGNLELAFPGGTYNSTDGTYDIGTIGTTERAVQIIMIDGTGKRMGIYMGRCVITTGDMPELNAEEFFELKIHGSILTDNKGQRMRIFPPKAYAGLTSTVAPTVTAASPSGATAGATVTITGTNFNGTTAVKFGVTAASSFSVVSNTSITAVMPAGTAGSAPITVTNNVGTSSSFAYTRGA